ncbi:hypothetical protein EV360DRAFT_85721 [Lentinula raphanica]|nr:hypothetical protein EV360DRAFT_85721 [Lentinula raphanica]
MILIRLNTTVMLFAVLGMISVRALPVPANENAHSVQTQGFRATQRETSQSNPVDQPTPRDKPPLSWQPTDEDLQLGPGAPNLWPPVGKKPVSVPPVAFPPGFPSRRLVVYTRIARIPGTEPSLKGKVESLQQSSIWESIDPKIRDAQLRSQAYVRGDPRRKKLLNAYLILANNKNKVVEQINWLQETLFYLHYQVYYSEIIKRVLKDSDLELEPDDMIKLGLADPSEASFGYEN